MKLFLPEDLRDLLIEVYDKGQSHQRSLTAYSEFGATSAEYLNRQDELREATIKEVFDRI